MAKMTDELSVMRRLERAMLELEDEAVQARVLAWLAARFNAPALAPRDGCRAVPLAPARKEDVP